MKNLFKRIKNFAKKCWEKFEELCKKISKKNTELINWAVNHPEVVSVLGIFIGTGKWIFDKFHKTSAEKEQQYQRTHIYDYTLGHHWTLKRDLTANEMFEYEKRKSNGEQLGNILRSMGVLA